jgi:sugar lactone lactonase YvrE
MSKINTETMIEEGRYMVRPDGSGSPSRTTVNLSGDVAIAARSGGITKVWANTDQCEESNGQPGIQTSTGGNDVLAWDMEECRAWHTPMNYVSHRPMAWAAGKFNQKTCGYDDEMLWTSGSIDWSSAEVLLVDGETGQVDETVVIPQQHASGYLYGGAVDGDSNFWGLQNSSRILRVDREDFTISSWAIPGGPGYGIAVDAESRVWLCGGGHAQRFDPQTEQWQKTPGASTGIGGCMTDGETTLYHSKYGQGGVMVAIDTETVTPIKEYIIPAYVHGVSVDFAGKVWGVTFGGSQAFRLDPETEQVDTFNGLVGAYTYSDMTGFALNSVGNPNG